MNVLERIGARSLTSHAAGRPVPSVTSPIIRNVQAGPNRESRPFMAKLMTDPPIPPPA